ncbi:hypothetical protein MHJ97_11350 [Macrococcus epidermidis]|uniref:hypothetical protein n=1 Tax=Macrococcus epidermidis TaxID=1902580 RepID=UPI001EF30FB9|nr:hypothetical protein [Macrococcus epidermidis]MCG7421019.1 hypothetical protein [Macrococcus epidermidis]
MKHIEVDDKLVNQIFNKFIKKISPFGIAYLGLHQINRIQHKRYDIFFTHCEDKFHRGVNEAIDLYIYFFVKNIISAFHDKRLLTLSYHTESFEVQYSPDIYVDYPAFPNSDDVLYYLDDDNMIWIPWFGHSIYVIGEKLIEVIDVFSEKNNSNNNFIKLLEHKSRKFFKDREVEERGPVVDLIMKANVAVIDHVEIYEETFALIDDLVAKNYKNYSIYGETIIDEKLKLQILKDIRNKQYNREHEPIVKEFEAILNTYNMTSLIISGV